MKRLLLVWLALWLGACGSGASSDSPPAASAHLGANLPGISDYSRTPVYVDLMHQARHFGSTDAPWDENATLGADGWPVGDFGVWLMVGQSQVAGTAGVYQVSYKGRATLRVEASSARVLSNTYDAAQDLSRAEIEMPPGEDQLALSLRDTGAGVRDLHVIRPGYDAAQPPLFTRAFLDHIARFKVLRFMDWLRTNGNPVQRWAERASDATTHHTSAAGVPWEHVVALANETGADIWINIPVRADDDYVHQLAVLLRDTLNTKSQVYVEYSNELWNGGFSQFQVNVDLAQQELASNPASDLAYDGASDPNLLAFRRVGKRLKEISDIFRSVHGDAAMLSRVRPVLAGQVVQPYVVQVGLEMVEAVYGPPAHYFHAIAGAPYFNMGDRQTQDGLSTAEVMQALGQSVVELPVSNGFEKNRALASWYGLHWLAYEGGPDTFGPGSLAAKKAANLDPAMLDMCLAYLDTWYRAGGELFMWFTAGAGNWDTQYGTWELTTDLTLTSAPKLQCTDRAQAAAPPAGSARNSVPGQFDALAYAGNLPPYSAGSANAVRYMHPGSHVDYLVHAAQAGRYGLVLNAEVGDTGNRLGIAINGTTVVAGLDLVPTGWGTPADQPAISLTLPEGFSTLRLSTVAESSGFGLKTLTLR